MSIFEIKQPNEDMKMRILFRVDKIGKFKGDITAIFVDELFTHYGTDLTCYAHIGQHSAASLTYAKSCKAATQVQYFDLFEQ